MSPTAVVAAVLVAAAVIEARIAPEAEEEEAAPRTRCQIYDPRTEAVTSQYCDALPEHRREDGEKRPEFFCHAVWSNTSDPATGRHVTRLLQQQCTSNLGNAHDTCRNQAACLDTTAGRPGQRGAASTGEASSRYNPETFNDNSDLLVFHGLNSTHGHLNMFPPNARPG